MIILSTLKAILREVESEKPDVEKIRHMVEGLIKYVKRK